MGQLGAVQYYRTRVAERWAVGLGTSKELEAATGVQSSVRPGLGRRLLRATGNGTYTSCAKRDCGLKRRRRASQCGRPSSTHMCALDVAARGARSGEDEASSDTDSLQQWLAATRERAGGAVMATC